MNYDCSEIPRFIAVNMSLCVHDAHDALRHLRLHMIHYFIASQKLSMSEPFGEFVKKYDARKQINM